jgi:hypothetical protein
MYSGRYVHPEFGYFASRPRLRRELRVGFFSMLFGMGIGAVSVIALSVGNRNPNNASVSPSVTHGAVTAPLSVATQPADAMGAKHLEGVGINTDRAKTANEGDTSRGTKPVGFSADTGPTACEGNNLACANDLLLASHGVWACVRQTKDPRLLDSLSAAQTHPVQRLGRVSGPILRPEDR